MVRITGRESQKILHIAMEDSIFYFIIQNSRMSVWRGLSS